MSENIEYRCAAHCIHNNYSGTGYSPCHLKNRGLKKNKDTTTCYGTRCGFYENIYIFDKIQKESKR